MSITTRSVATVNQIAGTTASVTLFAAASDTIGRYVYNSGTVRCYVLCGTASAASTALSFVIAGGTGFQFPTPTYSGPCTIVWDTTGAGTAYTTQW